MKQTINLSKLNFELATKCCACVCDANKSGYSKIIINVKNKN